MIKQIIEGYKFCRSAYDCLDRVIESGSPRTYMQNPDLRRDFHNSFNWSNDFASRIGNLAYYLVNAKKTRQFKYWMVTKLISLLYLEETQKSEIRTLRDIQEASCERK